MYEHNVGLGTDRLQPLTDTCRTGRSACDDDDPCAAILVEAHPFRFIRQVFIRNDDHDSIAAQRSSSHSMIDDAATSEIFELLHRPESSTRTSSNDNRPDLRIMFRRRTIGLDIGHGL